MVVEELIGKLGLKVGNLGDAKKFIKTLQDCRRALKDLDKGANVNLGRGFAGTRGLRDIERMTAAMRRYRKEADLAARAGSGGFRPGRGGNPFYPGHSQRQKDRRGGMGLDDFAAGAGMGLGRVGAAAAGAYGAGELLRKSLNSSMNFERAMIAVQNATDATTEDLERHEKVILRLAKDTGQSKESIAGMYAEAGKSGVPVEDLPRATEFAAKAAKAWDVTTDVAGKRLAELRATYQTTQEGIESLGDAINITADSGSAAESDILDVLMRVGATGKQIGFTTSQMLAYVGAMKNVGISNEVTSTGLEALFNTMKLGEKVMDKADEGFKALGVNAKQMQKDFIKEPFKTTNEFLDKLNGVTDPIKKAEILTNIFGKEHQDDITRLLNLRAEIERLDKNVRENQAAGKGTVRSRFDDRMKRDVSKVDQAMQQFDVLMKRFGDPMKRGLGAGAERLNEALDYIDDRTGNKTAAPLNSYDELPGLEHLRPTGVTRSQFDERFAGERLFGATRSLQNAAIPNVMRQGRKGLALGYANQGQQTGLAPTFSPSNFSIPGVTGGGAEMAQKAMQTVTNNITNNTNTGNDQRQQSVTVNQTVNGVPGVSSAAAEGAKSGLSSMGASVAKAHLTPTTSGASESP